MSNDRPTFDILFEYVIIFAGLGVIAWLTSLFNTKCVYMIGALLGVVYVIYMVRFFKSRDK